MIVMIELTRISGPNTGHSPVSVNVESIDVIFEHRAQGSMHIGSRVGLRSGMQIDVVETRDEITNLIDSMLDDEDERDQVN